MKLLYLSILMLLVGCGWGGAQSTLPTGQITVNGLERSYRFYIPENLPDGPRPLLLSVHGADGRDWAFPQESRFAALAESEGIILANPLSHHVGGNEGEWQLNTPPDARHDIAFIEAIIDDLAGAYSIDASRIYATGYSIGSMFTYELACQLSDRIAAIASFAGTMPVNPNSCDIPRGFPVMHIHGDDDSIIGYGGPWDWKAWDSVGTMHGIPGLIEYWKTKNACQTSVENEISASRHIIHSDCTDDVRVEHIRLSRHDHDWPETIDGVSTHQVIWNFLSGFQKP